jgi:hypothetical protein
MIEDFLKMLFLSIAVIGWIFFIICTVIFIRWIKFVHRNPNAQDIINQILLRVIFFDNY